MPEYPEHEKLHAVKDVSQAIGEFIEFGGYTLCKFRDEGDNGEPQYQWTDFGRRRVGELTDDAEPVHRDLMAGYAEHNPRYESWREGFEAVGEPIQSILAHYFDIDLDKIEAEKRAMLDALRALNA